MELLATGAGQTVTETGAPTHCSAGHELRAGTMLVGFDSPDPATIGPIEDGDLPRLLGGGSTGGGWQSRP